MCIRDRVPAAEPSAIAEEPGQGEDGEQNEPSPTPAATPETPEATPTVSPQAEPPADDALEEEAGFFTLPSAQNLTISDVDDLTALAASVNGGDSYEGATVTLAADLDLSRTAWTPIGTKSSPFDGTFDGLSLIHISARRRRRCPGGWRWDTT